MERVYIEWNIVNWITIVLMAAIGLALVGLVSSSIQGANKRAE
jgi:hypothetical protein